MSWCVIASNNLLVRAASPSASMAGWRVLQALCMLLVCCYVRSWPTVDAYKNALGIGVGPMYEVRTSHTRRDVVNNCVDALVRLASDWHFNGTIMSRLAKPSYVFRLQDAPHRPTLGDLLDPSTATEMWLALFNRLLAGAWVDPAWKAHVDTDKAWEMDALCYKFKKALNGNTDPEGEDLCLPVRHDLIPGGRRGPLHTRHYLSSHKDGYIRVNLGTDEHGTPVQPCLHTIIALAFHGSPDFNHATGAWQEVCHLCNNPWCINPRHIYWCSHQENCAA